MIRLGRRVGLVLLVLLGPAVLAQRVEFRSPRAVAYELPSLPDSIAQTASPWLTARRPGHSRPVVFGRRVVVQTTESRTPDFARLTPNLRLRRQVNSRTWVLEASDARTAVLSAARLAREPGIALAFPTQRRRVRPHYPLAPVPNDPYFRRQYSLETQDSTAAFLPVSVDLNARAAWAHTQGENVVIGVGDDGIELTHPDLADNIWETGHNFLTGAPTGEPVARSLYHGTAVAGLIAAVGDNHLGLTGVAPRSRLTSWVIFDETDTSEPDEVGFAEMFGTANQEVGVQNHSWGNADYSFVELSLLEDLALEEAVTTGRGGRGVVLVRSSGNTRQQTSGGPAGDANLDGYANDPRQITVAAVRTDGRFASYSTPGSCVLVAAPGGDFRGGHPGLVTTDRTGTAGLNGVREPGDPTSFDYLVGARLFVGTSAAAPLVSGVAALVLSARPELRWFEVQQILALSARHVDLTDAELRVNGAGFRVSPNTGFGIPDAGVAVRLAHSWKGQAAPVNRRYPLITPQVIPDAGETTTPARFEFEVSDSLVLQQVRVRLLWSHARGRDLRVSLTSPTGFTSPLLRTGSAAEPVPEAWTFSSVQHLGEASAGRWILEITDTVPGEIGQVDEAELILDGREITDTDRDGLDDAWEQAAFDTLDRGPEEDPDGDGWTNAAEQLAGRDPTQRDEPFVASLGTDPDGRFRLSWPGTPAETYEIWARPDLGTPPTLVTNVPGRFPEAGWRWEADAPAHLFEVRRSP